MNIKNSFQTRIIALLFLTSLSLVFSRCKKDNLEGTTLNDSDVNALPANVQSELVAASGITSSSYYLENSLPSGYVKDGSRDYTSYIQAAVTKYSNVVFPAFPLLVNDKGIVITSNKVITFLEGSEIRLKGTSLGSYDILKISGASNVTLYNPVIVGDRNSHSGTTGEWGMGIGIRGSSNITIYGPNVTNCWGDGIYLGQLYGKGHNKNIVIKDAYLRKNRRDGISIISVDGLLVENIYAGYTDGTSPRTGINFEPNNPECELKNVVINNPRTENNGSRGIQINAKHMLGSVDKTSDITIVNHIDIGSTDNSLKLNINSLDGATGKMYGTLNIVNPAWHKVANNVPLNLSTNQPNYKTTISSPEVMYMNGSILSWSETYALLMKQASRTSLIVTNTLTDPASTITEPVSTVTEPAPVQTTPIVNSPNVVFAINAGGSSFKASSGITYSADKSYNGGAVYAKITSINKTSDDVLYQSERKGNFSYAIPLAKGTYEITFKMAELYHSAVNKRKFDISGENVILVSDLDIFKEAGKYSAFDIVRRITVNDGTLNLRFSTDVDNAKLSAFHIVKE